MRQLKIIVLNVKNIKYMRSLQSFYPLSIYVLNELKKKAVDLKITKKPDFEQKIKSI